MAVRYFVPSMVVVLVGWAVIIVDQVAVLVDWVKQCNFLFEWAGLTHIGLLT